MYSDQRRSSTSSNASASNMSLSIKEEPQSPSQGPPMPPSTPHHQSSHSSSHPSTPNSQHRDRDRERDRDHQQHQGSKVTKSSNTSQNSSANSSKSSSKDQKSDDKEVKVKQEGQKPTMETQGPPPPPTSQYYIHPSYMGGGPFGFDPAAHPMYRNMNMMVPGAPYNTPYLQMARFHAPEDLSRNTGTKALDLLQHHASQFYNPHKIHELSERALKSPNSNPNKVAVSSPSVTQQPPQNNISTSIGSTPGHGSLSSSTLPPPPISSLPPGIPSSTHGPQKNSSTLSNSVAGNDKLMLSGANSDLPPGKEGSSTGRSPPPQRHVHTHHHTHVGVGLGYPMYPATYGGE